MPWPTFTAGMTLTAADLSDMQWQSVEQGTQADVTSSTTLVDTNLEMTAVAGATYMYRLLAAYQAGATGDITFAWTAPTNGAVLRFAAGVGNDNTGADVGKSTTVSFRRPATTTMVDIGGTTVGGASAAHHYREDGVIVGGDGGTFTLQFAQATSNATASSVTASSRLDWVRIG